MAYVENLLSSDEQILVKQRPHWLAFIGPIISLVWGAIFLVILIQLLNVSGPPRGLAALLEQFFPFRSVIEPVVRGLPPWLLPVLFLLYGVSIVFGFLSRELRLLNIISLITTQRVIEVRGVLSKTVLDTSLEKITDVRLNQSWLGRLLGYGHLSIMTASEMGFNDMHYLPNPVEFKRMMLEAKNAMPGMRSGRVSAPAQQGNITERLVQLEQLRQQGMISQSEFEARRQKMLDEI